MAPTRQQDSLEHALATPGTMTFKTQLNLWHMLYPDVQPGMVLGHTYPLEDVNIFLHSAQPLEVRADSGMVYPSVKKEVFMKRRSEERSVGKGGGGRCRSRGSL